ncbi:MAG: hypothetical protein LBM75_08180 [Myxococcales bacterium]|nr:hypothetical protein [Myxococcales bacterium]
MSRLSLAKLFAILLIAVPFATGCIVHTPRRHHAPAPRRAAPPPPQRHHAPPAPVRQHTPPPPRRY